MPHVAVRAHLKLEPLPFGFLQRHKRFCIETRCAENSSVACAYRCVGNQVQRRSCNHGGNAFGNVLVSSDVFSHQHGRLGKAFALNRHQAFDHAHFADRRIRTDHLPASQTRRRTEQRPEAAQQQRQHEDDVSANHFLAENRYRPSLGFERLAQSLRFGLHFGIDRAGHLLYRAA